ncbi:hypothetical protein EG68_04151 [Paragonimus skrjabini miyazakii]|uniref:Uncharacterized protein n=1 Tax=Paragonimus skrjabini miyazakii TaxID=59628 RepID=A0A8S9YU23_9TREM|nr:hypothetical protein EG68_04151 [Paragonimus skrjabini miyazakii]
MHSSRTSLIGYSTNILISPYSRHGSCPLIWPLSAEARTKGLSHSAEEVRLAHCNAHSKPESTFPKERQIKNFMDHGQPLLLDAAIDRFYLLYYAFRKLSETCFV